MTPPAIPRLGTLLSLALIVASALGLYGVKYRVQAIQAELRDLGQQLDEERESLHVVAAEWSYLNQPERLQRLSGKYLKLKSVDVRQIAEVADIPYPAQQLAGPRVTPVAVGGPLGAE